MEASKKTDAKKKLKSAAIKAAGTVTAAGMLLNAAVEPEDLLTSPEQKAQSASSAHVQSGTVPVYTVKGSRAEKAPAPTKAELLREKVISLPAPVKGLVLLPLWTVGAIANYALSLLLSLFAKVFGGSILTFLFQFALLFGLFALALKLLFPNKKLKDRYEGTTAQIHGGPLRGRRAEPVFDPLRLGAAAHRLRAVGDRQPVNVMGIM